MNRTLLAALLAAAALARPAHAQSTTQGFSFGLSVPSFAGIDVAKMPSNSATEAITVSVANGAQEGRPYVARVSSAEPGTHEANDTLRLNDETWNRFEETSADTVVYEVGYF